MKKIMFLLFTFIGVLYADSLNNLLKEYEDNSQKSLQTVNEKLGHVLVYSQKELKLMQHNKLGDVLKELPLLNLNRNRYGLTSPSLAGTKTTVSGFFRLFVNDHEVSSIHTQSFALSWGEMPLDFVDYIEVYYGESSFSLGNETGIYFIRVYTKSALKENSTQLKTLYTDNNSFSQSLTHSESLENGWSYLLFFNQNNIKNEMEYKNELLKNDMKSRYFYVDMKKDTLGINIGFNDIKKESYMGLSLDLVPNNGELNSQDYFINVSKSFLDDDSLKIGASYNIYKREYKEDNDEGLGVLPLIDFTQPPINTIPKKYKENLKYIKSTGYVTKNFKTSNNQLLTSFHIKKKEYKLINRESTNLFGQVTSNKKFNDFNKETIYSFILEDNYTVNDKLLLIANSKFDKYDRNAYLKDSDETMYKVGAIYTPTENFGLKTFYTKTYLPPSFYNTEFASSLNKDIKTQKYNFYTTEAVFAFNKSKFSITYHNVEIEDFIYFAPIGFINVDHKIKTEGLIFDYKYQISKNNKMVFNYYFTKSSEDINNSDKGGYIKFMGNYSKFEYFSSLIYKNKFEFRPEDSNHISVDASYNLNVGATYNYNKDISISLKGENLLDKSTKSLFTDGFPGTNTAIKDFDRTVSLTFKLVF